MWDVCSQLSIHVGKLILLEAYTSCTNNSCDHVYIQHSNTSAFPDLVHGCMLPPPSGECVIIMSDRNWSGRKEPAALDIDNHNIIAATL